MSLFDSILSLSRALSLIATLFSHFLSSMCACTLLDYILISSAGSILATGFVALLLTCFRAFAWLHSFYLGFKCSFSLCPCFLAFLPACFFPFPFSLSSYFSRKQSCNLLACFFIVRVLEIACLLSCIHSYYSITGISWFALFSSLCSCH